MTTSAVFCVYPGEKQPYKTAFLFLEDYEEEKVPPWAMRMRIDEGQVRYNEY